MGQRCCFSYFQLVKQSWTVEFTIDIFTGMDPLLVWALGLCTYHTPLEPALSTHPDGQTYGCKAASVDHLPLGSNNHFVTQVLYVIGFRVFH
jgi:hypothetical protein